MMKITSKITDKLLIAFCFALFTPLANADWLTDAPGTLVSVQVDRSGALTLRPSLIDTPQEGGFGGPWFHPTCQNPNVAILKGNYFADTIIPSQSTVDKLYDLLTAAAANGAHVRIFADPDLCTAQGWVFIRAVRVQNLERSPPN